MKTLFRILFTVFAICSLGMFNSCNQEDDVGLALNNEREKIVITKYFDLAEEVKTMWPSYQLPYTKPILLIFPNEAGEDQYGYLLNIDGTPPVGSGRVRFDSGNPTPIYRNDDLVVEAKKVYGDVLPPFAFDFSFQGKSFFLSKSLSVAPNAYINYKMKDHNDAPMGIIHELFHEYQFFSSAPWQLSDWKQDQNKFPQTAEIIELSLLLFDEMMKAYHSGDSRAYLEKYVSIRRKQIELDPSAEKLILKQATYTESVEGSARYLEHFGALQTIYPSINDDPSHTFKAQLDTVATANHARHILVQRVPYHVGAIVIKLLLDQKVEVLTALPKGETPYTIAKAWTGKTDAEYDQILEQLKISVDWPRYQARAQVLAGLLK